MALDTLSCIKSFVSVAQYGSFSQAASKMYLSQSVVTKQIQTLEQELGVSLLTRTTRSLTLTNAGHLYLEKAKKILSEIKSANEAVKNISEEPSGIIKLSIPGFFQGGEFVHILTKFLIEYPKVQFIINNNMSPFQLLDKSADIVISEFKVRDTQFNCDLLFVIEKNVYAAPSYLAKHGTPKKLDDLKNHNCLIYEIASPTHEWRFAKNSKVKISGNYIVSGGVSLIPAAIAGIGLTWIPDILVKDEVKRGDLVKLNIEPGAFLAQIYIYHLPLNSLGLVKLFIRWLNKQLQ